MTSLDPIRGTPAWGAGEGSHCGTSAGYTRHFERGEKPCTPCREARAAWMYRYKIRRYLAGGRLMVDAIGVHRRLRALACNGWSWTALAPLMGVHMQQVSKWAVSAQSVYPSTFERVLALYDELWDQPGPSQRMRVYAARQGWSMALCWDDDTIDDPKARPAGTGSWSPPSFDEIAVQRAMRGDRVHVNPSERAEAARRLKAHGFTARRIAERLHIDVRSAQRLVGPEHDRKVAS